MKRTTIYIISILLTGIYSCQNMHEDIHPKMASYIGNNELRMNMLRHWDIYYEQERDLWNCRHWHSKDSIKTFVQVQTDVLNNIKYSNYLISNEDSINSLHTALQNIQTLNDIRKICKSDIIGTHEVSLFCDTLAYDYVINVKLSATTLQLLLLKGDSIIIGEPMYGKWHFRELYR